MLILTRRVTESLMIGNDVTVTILGIKGCQPARKADQLPASNIDQGRTVI